MIKQVIDGSLSIFLECGLFHVLRISIGMEIMDWFGYKWVTAGGFKSFEMQFECDLLFLKK